MRPSTASVAIAIFAMRPSTASVAVAIFAMRPSTASVDKEIPSTMQHDLFILELRLFHRFSNMFHDIFFIYVISSCFGNHERNFKGYFCCLTYLRSLFMTLVHFYNKQQFFSSPISIICLGFVTEKHFVDQEMGTEFLYNI